MGIIANIYRWSLGDCSLDGISSNHNAVCVINAEGPFEPSAEQPAVELMTRNVSGVLYVRAVPVEVKGEWSMHGGTFIYSTDSRFGEAVERLINRPYHAPVALHDRVERS